MKLLKTITDKDFSPEFTSPSTKGYGVRTAARAIVQDADGKIALLSVTKNHYHKLPGGGVEAGEDIPLALAREILEEIGCEAEVVGEVGQITEYRDQQKLRQESFCYLAKVTGEKGEPAFTDEEKAHGFAVEWVTNLEEAIKILQADQPLGYEGQFIRMRDLTLLQEAITK